MEQFEDTKVEMPKFITPFRAVLAIAIISVSVLIYEFGWKKIEAGIYERGYVKAQEEINKMVVNELFASGRLQIILPANDKGEYDINGTATKPIILIPQQ